MPLLLLLLLYPTWTSLHAYNKHDYILYLPKYNWILDWKQYFSTISCQIQSKGPRCSSYQKPEQIKCNKIEDKLTCRWTEFKKRIFRIEFLILSLSNDNPTLRAVLPTRKKFGKRCLIINNVDIKPPTRALLTRLSVCPFVTSIVPVNAGLATPHSWLTI